MWLEEFQKAFSPFLSHVPWGIYRPKATVAKQHSGKQKTNSSIEWRFIQLISVKGIRYLPHKNLKWTRTITKHNHFLIWKSKKLNRPQSDNFKVCCHNTSPLYWLRHTSYNRQADTDILESLKRKAYFSRDLWMISSFGLPDSLCGRR